MYIIRIYNRNIPLLLSGQAISMAGDQLGNVAFLWLITNLTGSAAAVLAWPLSARQQQPSSSKKLIKHISGIFSLYGLFALLLMPLGYLVSILLSSVLSTGTITALAGVIMILTAFWLQLQSMNLSSQRTASALRERVQ
jgi:ABC-type multidrug transport system permease subunit